MGVLLCFELNSLDGGIITRPNDKTETLWLIGRGKVIFNFPKIDTLVCVDVQPKNGLFFHFFWLGWVTVKKLSNI